MAGEELAYRYGKTQHRGTGMSPCVVRFAHRKKGRVTLLVPADIMPGPYVW